jgi:Domain of unknown function (DUF929)
MGGGVPPSQQRRAIAILSGIVAVVVIGVVVVIAHLATSDSNGSGQLSANDPTVGAVAVPSDVNRAVRSVPSDVISEVGRGTSVVAMKALTAAPLVTNGKPTVLFVGGEFCPYCAAERWAILQALSRFGTFSDVGEIRSSEGGLPTFEFARATYASNYVAFTPVEIEGQQREPLEKLTPAQDQIFARYSPNRAFPFLYVNGAFVQDGSGFDPGVLGGQDQRQVAAALADPSSAQSRAIVGEANVLTAAICTATNNQPSDVCGNSAVTALKDSLTGTISG